MLTLTLNVKVTLFTAVFELFALLNYHLRTVNTTYYLTCHGYTLTLYSVQLMLVLRRLSEAFEFIYGKQEEEEVNLMGSDLKANDDGKSNKGIDEISRSCKLVTDSEKRNGRILSKSAKNKSRANEQPSWLSNQKKRKQTSKDKAKNTTTSPPSDAFTALPSNETSLRDVSTLRSPDAVYEESFVSQKHDQVLIVTQEITKVVPVLTSICVGEVHDGTSSKFLVPSNDMVSIIEDNSSSGLQIDSDCMLVNEGTIKSESQSIQLGTIELTSNAQCGSIQVKQKNQNVEKDIALSCQDDAQKSTQEEESRIKDKKENTTNVESAASTLNSFPFPWASNAGIYVPSQNLKNMSSHTIGIDAYDDLDMFSTDESNFTSTNSNYDAVEEYTRVKSQVAAKSVEKETAIAAVPTTATTSETTTSQASITTSISAQDLNFIKRLEDIQKQREQEVEEERASMTPCERQSATITTNCGSSIVSFQKGNYEEGCSGDDDNSSQGSLGGADDFDDFLISSKEKTLNLLRGSLQLQKREVDEDDNDDDDDEDDDDNNGNDDNNNAKKKKKSKAQKKKRRQRRKLKKRIEAKAAAIQATELVEAMQAANDYIITSSETTAATTTSIVARSDQRQSQAKTIEQQPFAFVISTGQDKQIEISIPNIFAFDTDFEARMFVHGINKEAVLDMKINIVYHLQQLNRYPVLNRYFKALLVSYSLAKVKHTSILSTQGNMIAKCFLQP